MEIEIFKYEQLLVYRMLQGSNLSPSIAQSYDYLCFHALYACKVINAVLSGL